MSDTYNDRARREIVRLQRKLRKLRRERKMTWRANEERLKKLEDENQKLRHINKEYQEHAAKMVRTNNVSLEKLRSQNMEELRSAYSELETKDMQIRATDSKLKAKNTQRPAANSKLKKVAIENKILRQRPVIFDPILSPVARLPAELQCMVQAQALKVDRPINEQLLDSFLLTTPPTFNGIKLPYEARPNHLKTLLRANTVTLTALAVYQKRLSQTMKKCGASFEKDVVSVHWMLDTKIPTGRKKTAHAQRCKRERVILKQCTGIKHLIVELDVDSSTVGTRNAKETLKASGYEDLLLIPRNLKTLRIVANKEGQLNGPDQIGYVQRWAMDMVAAIGDVVLQGNPQCKAHAKGEVLPKCAN